MIARELITYLSCPAQLLWHSFTVSIPSVTPSHDRDILSSSATVNRPDPTLHSISEASILRHQVIIRLTFIHSSDPMLCCELPSHRHQ
jgi:hypothetical protein